MRACNEGDLSRRHAGPHLRPGVAPHRDRRSQCPIGASVTMAAVARHPALERSRRRGARGRRAGHPQHGDGRRQPVRPDAIWRFCRSPAGARSPGRRSAGKRWISTRSCACARGSTALSRASVCAFPRLRPSASSRVSRVKPKGVSVPVDRGCHRGGRDGHRRGGAHRARLHGGSADPRPQGGRSADRRTLTEHGVASSCRRR